MEEKWVLEDLDQVRGMEWNGTTSRPPASHKWEQCKAYTPICFLNFLKRKVDNFLDNFIFFFFFSPLSPYFWMFLFTLYLLLFFPCRFFTCWCFLDLLSFLFSFPLTQFLEGKPIHFHDTFIIREILKCVGLT